jgi:hypothetical protein
MNPPDDRASGKLERVGQGSPPVDVDCSGWQRAAGPRSRGKLVGVATHQPPATVGFVREPAAWLEVVVSFDDSVTPATVFGQTFRFIHALHEQYRRQGLALEYDTARSRTEGEQVVVALRLNAPISDEQRGRAVAITRSELAKLTGAKLERVDWPAAA